MEIRAVTREEEKYLYEQSIQLQGQTGYIGKLICDWNNSQLTWSGGNERLRTGEFVEDYNKVISTLRGSGNPLHSMGSMMDFVTQHPESVLKNHKSIVYGFRIDTEKHSYLLRLPHPVTDYHAYCLCYVKESLDRHVEKARNGIRFITSKYEEVFCIADGDRVIITTATGGESERICRYIDECHVEVGNNLYHVCEFAELMEKIGSTCRPVGES